MTTTVADFTIKSGSEFCEIDSNGCVTDGEGNYGPNEECIIVVNQDGVLAVPQLDLQTVFDYDEGTNVCLDALVIGGLEYCMDADGYSGAGHPNRVEVSIGDEIRYYTDQWRHQGGFVMCLVTSGGSDPGETIADGTTTAEETTTAC